MSKLLLEAVDFGMGDSVVTGGGRNLQFAPITEIERITFKLHTYSGNYCRSMLISSYGENRDKLLFNSGATTSTFSDSNIRQHPLFYDHTTKEYKVYNMSFGGEDKNSPTAPLMWFDGETKLIGVDGTNVYHTKNYTLDANMAPLETKGSKGYIYSTPSPLAYQMKNAGIGRNNYGSRFTSPIPYEDDNYILYVTLGDSSSYEAGLVMLLFSKESGELVAEAGTGCPSYFFTNVSSGCSSNPVHYYSLKEILFDGECPIMHIGVGNYSSTCFLLFENGLFSAPTRQTTSRDPVGVLSGVKQYSKGRFYDTKDDLIFSWVGCASSSSNSYPTSFTISVEDGSSYKEFYIAISSVGDTFSQGFSDCYSSSMLKLSSGNYRFITSLKFGTTVDGLSEGFAVIDFTKDGGKIAEHVFRTTNLSSYHFSRFGSNCSYTVNDDVILRWTADVNTDFIFIDKDFSFPANIKYALTSDNNYIMKLSSTHITISQGASGSYARTYTTIDKTRGFWVDANSNYCPSKLAYSAVRDNSVPSSGFTEITEFPCSDTQWFQHTTIA